jgi:citronellol/citronellal dehydrogenase
MSYRSVLAPHLFDAQLIIVVGGGSGVGRCAAHELASLGAHVVLVGRKAEKLTRVAREIEAEVEGGRATTCPCDIRDKEAVSAMVSHTVTRYGRVHGLVINSSAQSRAAREEMQQKGFESVVSRSLVAGFLVAEEVFRQSMERDGGAIVNILADTSSVVPGTVHSAATHVVMESLTQSAAAAWASAGVRVNAVAPAWIASGSLEHRDESLEALVPRMMESVPLKRFGTEAEVSAAICFLLSPAAAFISGATLRVDGAALHFKRPS